jgi:hypothetical protein
MTSQALGGGEFTLRLIPRQKAAPLYWRSDTHIHTHDRAVIQCITLADGARGNCLPYHGLWVSRSSFPPKDLSPSREAYYRGPRM